MLHWTPALPLAFAGSRPAAVIPGDASTGASSRAEHARMLAHAAARRLRAMGEDRAYWLKGAPAALGRAMAIRTEGRLPRLP